MKDLQYTPTLANSPQNSLEHQKDEETQLRTTSQSPTPALIYSELMMCFTLVYSSNPYILRSLP